MELADYVESLEIELTISGSLASPNRLYKFYINLMNLIYQIALTNFKTFNAIVVNVNFVSVRLARFELPPIPWSESPDTRYLMSKYNFRCCMFGRTSTN